MRSCSASPHRACRARSLPPPWGSLLFRCASEPSQSLASLRDCHGSGIPVSFSFTPAPVRPRFARTPRSWAHIPSPPGRRRRPLRGDCFAPAACRTFSLSPSRQTSLCSDCSGRALSQRLPCPVPRCAWNGTRLRAASSCGTPGGSRHGLRRDCRLPPIFLLIIRASRRPRFARTPGSVDSPSGVARQPPVTSFV